jgi:hypothetical protein
MKAILSCALLLLVGAAPAVLPQPSTKNKVAGDYVEVRTASVFAGACHYNGELVTTGRDAVAAWSFTSGSWEGTDLAGVRAAAAITSDANLGQQDAARKVELVVDSSATAAQASAVRSLLASRCASTLGQIVAVRRAPISFAHVDKKYAVNVDGFAAMTVEPMPNNECCAQPNLVWYAPLSPCVNRKVGYVEHAAYTAGTIGDRWQREGENSAFYGAFSF